MSQASTLQTTTTTRACWPVDKISLGEQVDNGGTNFVQPSKPSLQWEHRTQRQHYLELETVSTTLTSSRQIVPKQMNLRILFDPLSNSQLVSTQHSPLVLMSVDLVSFSSRSTMTWLPSGKVPVKAVYRDTMLALQYLEPCISAAGGSEYGIGGIRSTRVKTKRLQVVFQSEKETEEFVEMIKLVCPCRKEEKKVEAVVEETQMMVASQTQVGQGGLGVRHERAQDRQRSQQSTSQVRQAAFNKFNNVLPSLSQLVSSSASTATLQATSSQITVGLSTLTDYEFEKMLLKILNEEGFVELVQRVDRSLRERGNPE
ncbi:hypothetical protein ACM66B_006757 [Microbotryomycetes sp. NB124-2]